MIKGIIFDFWGVICPDLYWNWLQTNVPGFDSNPALQQEFGDLSRRVDCAEMTSSEFYTEIGARTGWSPDQIMSDWKSKMSLNQDLVNVIAQLKAKYKIAVLSNSNDMIDLAIQKFDLAKYIDEFVISYKVKLVKPQPEIYSLAAQRLGVDPTEAIYIDDRSKNLDPAVALGMKTILYTSNEDILKKFAELSVI